MGQSTGIISEILAKVDYCEFCDKPSAPGSFCDVYTIEKFVTGEPAGYSKNIIVLCPSCKKNYDEGVFYKKHLKACVMFRDPALSEWLINLFGRYNFRLEQSAVNKGFFSRARYRLINDQNFIDNAIFLFGAFFIVTGVLLFAYGFNNVSNYDSTPAISAAGNSGQYSREYLFSMFFELAGVVFALLGLFFDLGIARGNVKANSH
jgi:hypothetical protein